LVLCGALLGAPALAKPTVADVDNPVPKNEQVDVKNAHKADAAKSDLTVPERKFVERAASDDIAQIELSRLALDKSQNHEVRNFAQTVIDDHKRSLDQLKKIANDQSFPLPTEASSQAQQQYQQLSKLEGARFDREYKQVMDRRHSEAIASFEKASKEAQHPDLKSYAEKTLPTLKEHRSELKK
jgi:putative membrane protein